MRHKKKLITMAAVCLLFSAAGIWYFLSGRAPEPEKSPVGIFQITPTPKTLQESGKAGNDTARQPEDRKSSTESKDSSGKSSADAPEEQGAVFICGEVLCPGVYEISAGDRLYEVVELAGGFTADADRSYHNLARVVSDGERIYILSMEETKQLDTAERISGEPASQEMTGNVVGQMGNAAGEKKVNINTADRKELETLPGIGESKAASIIEYRQTVGNFTAIEEIMNISGIGEAMFAKIKDKITVK